VSGDETSCSGKDGCGFGDNQEGGGKGGCEGYPVACAYWACGGDGGSWGTFCGYCGGQWDSECPKSCYGSPGGHGGCLTVVGGGGGGAGGGCGGGGGGGSPHSGGGWGRSMASCTTCEVCDDEGTPTGEICCFSIPGYLYPQLGGMAGTTTITRPGGNACYFYYCCTVNVCGGGGGGGGYGGYGGFPLNYACSGPGGDGWVTIHY